MCSFLFGARLQLPRGNPPAICHRGSVLHGAHAVWVVGAGEKQPKKAVFFCRVLCLLLVDDARAVRALDLRRNTGLYRCACRAVTCKELGAPECPTFQIFHTLWCAKQLAAFAGGRPFPLQAWLGLLCQGFLTCLCAPLGPGLGGGECSPKRKCLMRKPQLVSSRLAALV